MYRTIEQAVAILEGGGVIAAPTETFYGLSGKAIDSAVVDRIFALKERAGSKALPVIAGDLAAVEAAFDCPPEARAAMTQFWPGPLTLVLRPRGAGLMHLRADNGTVAVRVSPNPIISELARRTGGLVTSTSANLSGGPPVSRPDDLDSRILAGVDGVVDGGKTPGGLASTIAEWRGGDWVVHREGPISLAELRERVVNL